MSPSTWPQWGKGKISTLRKNTTKTTTTTTTTTRILFLLLKYVSLICFHQCISSQQNKCTWEKLMVGRRNFLCWMACVISGEILGDLSKTYQVTLGHQESCKSYLEWLTLQTLSLDVFVLVCFIFTRDLEPVEDWYLGVVFFFAMKSLKASTCGLGGEFCLYSIGRDAGS